MNFVFSELKHIRDNLALSSQRAMSERQFILPPTRFKMLTF